MAKKLNPKSLSKESQRFLFDCAFVVAAADSEIKAEEKDWLDANFGKKFCEELLKDALSVAGPEFGADLPERYDRLPEKQREKLRSSLKPWLKSLGRSDGLFSLPEAAVMKQLIVSLGIATKLSSPRKPSSWQPPRWAIINDPERRYISITEQQKRPPKLKFLLIFLVLGTLGSALSWCTRWGPRPWPMELEEFIGTFFGVAMIVSGTYVFFYHYYRRARRVVTASPALLIPLCLVCLAACIACLTWLPGRYAFDGFWYSVLIATLMLYATAIRIHVAVCRIWRATHEDSATAD